jgi:hypothetical protein
MEVRIRKTFEMMCMFLVNNFMYIKFDNEAQLKKKYD